MKKAIAICTLLLIHLYTLNAQTSVNGSLPPFVSFTAGIIGCNAVLNWNSGVEASGDRFLVERSINGADFHVIATIHGKGIIAPEYEYKDSEPAPGHNYYRIRRVNLTGYSGVTEIKPVFIRCGSSAVNVYPTLTSSTVNVRLSDGYEHAKITVISATGLQMAVSTTPVGLQRMVHLEGAPAGLYILQVVNGNNLQTFKVLKQ